MFRSITVFGIVSLLAVLVFTEPATAQPGFMPGFISGVVRDINDQPIANATVIGESSQWQRRVDTETNADGRFSFVGLQTGRWLCSVRGRGYQPVQGFAYVRGSGLGGRVSFVMETDPLNPVAPQTGVLANLRADELQEALSAADLLFETGEYDKAIEAYQAVLTTVPQLTSLHLQIGHAYKGKNDYQRALAAYRAIPTSSPIGNEAQDAIDTLQDDWSQQTPRR